ncbi:MAG: class I SAM-dependent methyltransferase [Abitibacteriaceae bacterium]|nr:class I SAM-dependent methyltransferase [Abditibacteriaceae bacterium]
MSQSADFTANIERFSGFAGLYNTFRPQPPPVLLDLLTQAAQITMPNLLVDLGCGTGLSTRFWAERAKQIIGIEPTDDMRQQAAEQTGAANITYQSGFSHQTGLSNACADIVTCSQALHWMAPQPTFEEAARILRPGGVFVAYDCDWPPTTSHWEAETAYRAFIDGVHQIEQANNLSEGLQKWAKEEHLSRMQASGCFRYTKELGVHHWEKGNAERLIGLALSQGGVATVLKHGFNESDIGLNELKAVLNRTLGDEQKPWCWSYKVRVGIV